MSFFCQLHRASSIASTGTPRCRGRFWTMSSISCVSVPCFFPDFRGNAVRLWLTVIDNLGNLWRRLALPKKIGNWSLTSLQQRLVISERDYARKRSEEHTSELQSLAYLVCRLLLEKKKKRI